MTTTIYIIAWDAAGTLFALGLLGLFEMLSARARRAAIVRRMWQP
jgi:hypothetical protein